MKVLQPNDKEVLELGLGWPIEESPSDHFLDGLGSHALRRMPTLEGIKYDQSIYFPAIKDYKAYLEFTVFGHLFGVQVGVCYGTCPIIATFETHGVREVVVAVTELWLALVPNLAAKVKAGARTGTIKKAIGEDNISIVKLEAGQAFAIAAETGHYTPNVPVDKSFIAGIILPIGTNTPEIAARGGYSLAAIGKYGVTSPGTPEAGRGWPIAVDGPFEFPAS